MGKAAYLRLIRFGVHLSLAVLLCCAIVHAQPALDVDRRGAELGAPIEQDDRPLAYLYKPMLLPPEPIAPRAAFEDALKVDLGLEEPVIEPLEPLTFTLPSIDVPRTESFVVKTPTPEELAIWSVRFDVTPPAPPPAPTAPPSFSVDVVPVNHHTWPVNIPTVQYTPAPQVVMESYLERDRPVRRVAGFVFEVLRWPFIRIRHHFQGSASVGREPSTRGPYHPVSAW